MAHKPFTRYTCFMSKVNKSLQILNKAIQGKNISKIAEMRLLRDLHAITVRVEKNEYESSGITKNIVNISDETKQFYLHLNTYARIAQTWKEVLQNIPLHTYPKILD